METIADPGFQVDEFAPTRSHLRISVVTETYPPEINGVSLTVAQMVEGLRQRGHRLQLVRPRQERGQTAGESEGFEEILLRGLPIPRYPQLRMGVPSARALHALWSLHRPDVVHVATEGPLGWSALQAASRLKLPLTSDFRTNFHAYSRHYGVGWLHKPIVAYLRKFHNRTDATTVPTEALREQLQALGFARLHVVARGVDAQRFSPGLRNMQLRAAWGLSPGTLALLCVGRLAPEKNLTQLVKTYQEIRQSGIDARLVLVGDGPAGRTLAQQVPDAVMCGMRSGEDLAAHYASADLFVFPSLTETYGNVTAEAMASGLPVLAYHYGAAAQLIRPGVNGMTVPVDDAPAFVRAALAMAADRPALQRMGQEARETALYLSWERIVSQIEGLFEQAIAQRPVSRSAMRWLPA